MRIFLISLFLIFFNGLLQSQTFINPNYSLKSHETLEITRIEKTKENTVFYMTIENRIVGGKFCADKNIYVIYPDGKKSKLKSSSGIPACPDTYEFRAIGEKLNFVLTFPSIREDVKWIDLVEDCRDNCFSFYGITLDNDLNKRIEEAFASGEKGDVGRTIDSFEKIAGEIDKENLGIEGMVYINIIKLSRDSGNEDKTEEWYKKFKLSGAPRLTQYFKYLNDQGIKY